MVAIGNDNPGWELKFKLTAELKKMGYEVINFGTDSGDPVDYPHYAKSVAKAIVSGRAAWGVLICASGIGIRIAANRYKEVRAALVHDTLGARLTREHTNANVLLGMGEWVATDILQTSLSTDFLPEVHGHRVDLLKELGNPAWSRSLPVDPNPEIRIDRFRRGPPADSALIS